jgi:hypothetical protein
MGALEMRLQAGPTLTSVCVEIRNLSAASMSVAAPNPYHSVWIIDGKGEPCTRVRAIKSAHSPKIARIPPTEALLATIDLQWYFDEVHGEVSVRIGFIVTDDSGVSQEQFAKGNVPLTILSYEERIAEMKRNPGPRGLPIKLFDVSDSTNFGPLK